MYRYSVYSRQIQRRRRKDRPIRKLLSELVEEIASGTGINYAAVEGMPGAKSNFYHSFTIPKRSGGHRNIQASQGNLKTIQKWIGKNILSNQHPSDHATAYRNNLGIRTNAETHENNSFLLKLDIKDFFKNVKWSSVNQVFRIEGFNARVCWFLTEICTLHSYLPQGAPTSPVLSNLTCRNMDSAIKSKIEIANHTGPHSNYAYTRYADDIFISGDDADVVRTLGVNVKYIIKASGFQVNQKKVRFSGPGHRKRITGLVIGSSGFGIGRTSERNMRARIHRLKNYSQKNTILPGSDYDHLSEISKIKGYLSFVSDVDTTRHRRLNTQLKRTLEEINSC